MRINLRLMRSLACLAFVAMLLVARAKDLSAYTYFGDTMDTWSGWGGLQTWYNGWSSYFPNTDDAVCCDGNPECNSQFASDIFWSCVDYCEGLEQEPAMSRWDCHQYWGYSILYYDDECFARCDCFCLE